MLTWNHALDIAARAAQRAVARSADTTLSPTSWSAACAALNETSTGSCCTGA
jgi:hypothetical protein